MADNNEDLFNEEETGTNQGEEGSPSGAEALAGTGDQAGEIVSKWVGDGKKFSSVDELVKSYDNSQQFIDQLKQENADMRRELSNAEKLDHILDRIEASGSENRTPKGESTSGETPSDGAGSNDANIEEQISKAVQNEVTRREKQRTAEQNQNQASDDLLELAGNDRNEAKRLLKKAATDLGVSVGYLQEQAQVSPSAFKRMVTASKEDGGSSGSLSDSGRSSGSQNPEAFEVNSFRSGNSDVQPWSHWQKLKKQMSKAEFYSPSVQNRIFKSRQELGERFFDTSS